MTEVQLTADQFGELIFWIVFSCGLWFGVTVFKIIMQTISRSLSSW